MRRGQRIGFAPAGRIFERNGIPPRWGAPSIDMDFTAGVLPPGLTFTRAGGGGRINSSGLYEWVGADVPRFDYDPVTLACKGLLIEENRTNLLPQSQTLATSPWSGGAGQATTNNGAIGLDGLMSATLATEDTGTNADRFRAQSVAATSGTHYTSYIVARRSAGQRHIYTLASNATVFGPSLPIAFLNMDTGVVTQSGGTNRSARAVNLGGGWWFLSLTTQAIASGSSGWRFGFSSSATDAFLSWAGDGASGVVFAATGIEAGAFPTSYIPTVASPVTRAADVLTMTGADFSRWCNPLEGTIVAEFSTVTNGLSNTGGNAFPFIYDIDSAAAQTSGHSLIASAGYGPGVRAQTQVAGVSQAELTSAVTLGTGAIIRHAYTYKANRFAASLNGGAVLTDVLGSLPTPDRLSIGSQDAGGSNTASIHLRRLLYYPRGVDDGRVQQLAVVS